jgi:hypothetical protein
MASRSTRQRTLSAPGALTTQTSIAFINGDPLSDNYNGLDAISIVPQTADQVPAVKP